MDVLKWYRNNGIFDEEILLGLAPCSARQGGKNHSIHCSRHEGTRRDATRPIFGSSEVYDNALGRLHLDSFCSFMSFALSEGWKGAGPNAITQPCLQEPSVGTYRRLQSQLGLPILRFED